MSAADGAHGRAGTDDHLRAVLLLDGKGGVQRDAIIVVQGSKIVKIASETAPPTYDLRTLTILPGLIDTHVHISYHFGRDGRASNRGETPAQEAYYIAENAFATLMAGFTTVQSVGATADVPLREAVARGSLPGPRILTAIRPLDENSGTPEQLRELVRKLKADGRREDLRVKEHPRRRRPDDDRRTIDGGMRRSEGARFADDGSRSCGRSDQSSRPRRLRTDRTRRLRG
ncbi:MAG: amidohydrolase family protein [Chloracidobacterium sp.]|nr:amidohydrolase family protein [Chloracidobacterium sp.]